MLIISIGTLVIFFAILHLHTGFYVLHCLIVVGTAYLLEKHFNYIQAGITPNAGLWFAIVHLLSINLITFIIYAYDKMAAIKGKWRIPEKTLHSFALIGGTPAAFLARYILRHKTIKGTFIRKFWMTIFLQVIVLVGLYYVFFM